MDQHTDQRTDLTLAPLSFRLRLIGAVAGLACALLIAVFPVVGILHGFMSSASPAQELSFCMLSTLTGTILGGILGCPSKLADAAAASHNSPSSPRSQISQISQKPRISLLSLIWQILQNQKWTIPLGKLLFAFLFVAAIALCVRLRLGVLEDDSTLIFIARSFGLAVFGLSACTALLAATNKKALAEKNLPAVAVRHPFYLSALIAFSGAPLVFATWLPLVALPGILVLMKWLVVRDAHSTEPPQI